MAEPGRQSLADDLAPTYGSLLRAGAGLTAAALVAHRSSSLSAGSRLRLKGLGVPYLNSGGRGDLLVHLDVHIPSKLTREQRRLFEQLRDVLPVENEPKEKGIFDKVKDYFL